MDRVKDKSIGSGNGEDRGEGDEGTAAGAVLGPVTQGGLVLAVALANAEIEQGGETSEEIVGGLSQVEGVVDEGHNMCQHEDA